MEGSRLPALLQPLLLHGGQIMSQRCSSEEHHVGQPARPQSSACRWHDAALGPTGRPPGATVTGGREWEWTEEGCILPGEIQGAAARDWKGQRPQTLQWAGRNGINMTTFGLLSLKESIGGAAWLFFPLKPLTF